MENIEISIHDLIVHKVNHKQHSEPQLADLKTPTNDEVDTFLARHIRNNQINKNTRTARFEDVRDDVSSLREMCDGLLNNPESFIERSRDIASHLFNVVKDDKRISPSDLVLCTYTPEDSDERHLTILKMDPQDGFTAQEVEENGQRRYELERVPEVLPRTDLQKCAFVLPPSKRNGQGEGFDLKVLDQQINTRRGRKAAATFFTSGFLQCTVNFNLDDKNSIWYEASYDYADKAEDRGEMTSKEASRFKGRVNDYMHDDEIQVAEFAERTIDDEEEREKYYGALAERGLEDTVFGVSEKVRGRVANQRKFVGDNGLKVEIDSEHYDSMVETEEDEETGEVVVTIRTGVWREKS